MKTVEELIQHPDVEVKISANGAWLTWNEDAQGWEVWKRAPRRRSARVTQTRFLSEAVAAFIRAAGLDGGNE